MERATNPRGSALRTAALAAVTIAAVSLPLAAATAGSPDRVGSGGTSQAPAAAPSLSTALPPPRGSGLLSEIGLAGKARCGPELASPEGVEAQTCVLSAGPDTWGRTYYRNATGRTLRAVLSLMRPDGRTVQVHCTLAAEGKPGACETPHAPGAGPNARQRGAATSGQTDGARVLAGGEAEGGVDYGAVAEIASADSDRLLLRSGSNPPESAAGRRAGATPATGAGHGSARSLATGDAPATGLPER
ncbi:hypothetical protein ACH429_10445 [Streptomyces pathocidini]|uniref:Uncharacterized protein n=1 Tax=Streptomyces pathocidini TaxID=1650571 RepID=A0ABW7UT48_9ACTN|nr:hypothetical protein [Streptomyces pathocidini]